MDMSNSMTFVNEKQGDWVTFTKLPGGRVERRNSRGQKDTLSAEDARKCTAGMCSPLNVKLGWRRQ